MELLKIYIALFSFWPHVAKREQEANIRGDCPILQDMK